MYILCCHLWAHFLGESFICFQMRFESIQDLTLHDHGFKSNTSPGKTALPSPCVVCASEWWNKTFYHDCLGTHIGIKMKRTMGYYLDISMLEKWCHKLFTWRHKLFTKHMVLMLVTKPLGLMPLWFNSLRIGTSTYWLLPQYALLTLDLFVKKRLKYWSLDVDHL